MKALCMISFALELENEDDLQEFAKNIDESLYKSVRSHFEAGMVEYVSAAELDGKIDWYGATICLKKPVFEGVEG